MLIIGSVASKYTPGLSEVALREAANKLNLSAK